MFHMQNESGAMVGKNGVRIFDVGECWRASSGVDVVNPQVLDYQTRGGQKDGTKYALGPDRLTGRTRIAYIDYPKKLYELDKLLDDDEVVHILTHCNVCSAVDQVINQPRQHLNRREQPSPPVSHHPSPHRMNVFHSATCFPPIWCASPQVSHNWDKHRQVDRSSPHR